MANPFVKTATFINSVSMPDHGLVYNGVRYYTVAEVAPYLHIARNTLHERLKEGMIPFIYQPGLRIRKKLISEPDLMKYVETL